MNKPDNMDTVVSHIKRIDRITGVTKIMTVGDVVDEIGIESRKHLERWGKFMITGYVYHVIDSQRAMMEILGKSIVFEMKDGRDALIKVIGIGFMGVITGIDDEGMNVTFNLADVYQYRMTRGGVH